MVRKVREGDAVVFVDSQRKEHNALVTKIWGMGEWDDAKPFDPQSNWPTCINTVRVSDDQKRSDSYGRQTIHESSVVHESINQAGGYMWKFKA